MAANKRQVRDIYPLTAMQQGMLVHALRTVDEPVYQQQFVLAIAGVPDADVLRAGVADLVARHTVLRTGFVWEGVDNPVQVVFADAPFELPVVVASASAESDVDDAVAAALTEQWARPFDLRRPPLLRAHAVRAGAGEWRLVLTIHHLVVDGWSMPTVQADLAALLTARVTGRPATLPPAAPFREFVTWLRHHDSADAAATHFKRLLGDLRHPTPLGIDRVGRVSVEPGPSGRVELFLRCAPDRQPDVLARRRGLLPSTIAHAAWGLLLARCAGTPDAVFGTTVSGRPAELPGVTERVGMFVNTVPIRVAVDGELPTGPWLAAVQEQLIAGRAFEHIPVAAAQRCSAVPLGEPLYESVLGFQNYFVDEPADAPAGPVTVRTLRQQEQTGLPLVVSVAFPPGATWVRVEFDEHRVDRPTAEWLADRYGRLLTELADAPNDLPVRDLPALGTTIRSYPQPPTPSTSRSSPPTPPRNPDTMAVRGAPGEGGGPDHGAAQRIPSVSGSDAVVPARSADGLGSRDGSALEGDSRSGSPAPADPTSTDQLRPTASVPADDASAEESRPAVPVPGDDSSAHQLRSAAVVPAHDLSPDRLRAAGSLSTQDSSAGLRSAAVVPADDLSPDRLRAAGSLSTHDTSADRVAAVVPADDSSRGRLRPTAPVPTHDPSADRLRAVGIGVGDRVLLWLPASMELVAGALGALGVGADVGQVSTGASPAELAEHCRGAAALVVPVGTRFAVPPPIPVVYMGLSELDDVGESDGVAGRWRGAAAGTLAEAAAVAASVPFVAGERAVLALGADDPALLPVAIAALNAGARLEFRDPLESGAGVSVGRGTWRVHGTDATGGVFACVPPGQPDFDAVPGGWVADAGGRAVPDAMAGELIVGEVRTGRWVRRRLDGTLELLGLRPGSEDVWVAARIRDDHTVTDAIVRGERAWVVSSDGDLPGLLARLRHTIPGALLPTDIHQLAELPRTMTGDVDADALRGQPTDSTPTEARPIAARLAALPDVRREDFLTGLRAARRATPPIRPGRIRGPVPRSVQQEFYADATLRGLVESTVDESGESRPDALTYADYAAWQADPRRAAERDRQEAHWRSVLRGAPASGIPADRVRPGAPALGHLELTVPNTATSEQWLAALAMVVARGGRDDDVVLGVVTAPHLPPELDGVPGPFARMLPIRLAVEPGRTTTELARAAATALDDARRNADVPWPRLRALLAHDPLVSVAVHDRAGERAAHTAATIGLDIAPGTHGTDITAVYDAHAIAEATVTALIRRTARVLELTGPVAAADLITDAERATILERGDGGTIHAEPATVPALIAEQDPNATAVVATDGELTYRELLDRATALATELRARGVGSEDRVAVCLPRTAATVWVPLGIMLAGAAYVPVDPKYPAARVAYVCANAHVSTVVTDDETRFPDGLTVLDPGAIPERDDAHDGAPADAARPEGAAYVLYTSGSTGEPKGVLVTHESVVDFARHIATAYRIGQDTRLLGFAALTFDVSVFDLWSALCNGATLVLAGDGERADVEALRRLLVDERVTAAELPPSLMPLLDPTELPDLRLVSVGGEAPPGVLVDDWASPEREFWNGYGPAETTVAVTLMRCEPPSGGRIPPIGLPMPNHRAYVLDERLRPVPPGVPGELCIAGTGLARGYLGRPGHTADRFVPDPFGGPGGRLYRTGDLARWAPDGVLEFLGRVDRQVKLRGFRVELGEVESVLAADDRVRQVAVEVWDGGGGRHLTAYVVPAADPPTLAEIREVAAARLPDYMVPTRLAVLTELPRTPSGKIDRRALPAPPEPAAADDAGEAGWSELERTIAGEVLGPLLSLSNVDRTTDFFELGGNSLQATQVTSRVRDRLGVEIALADFLAEPTVSRLAGLVERERGRAAERRDQVYATRPAARMTAGTVLPQSFPQEALFRAEERYGHDPRYNAPFAVRMRGPLDLAALRRAFAYMVRRHAALRVALLRDGDDYVQRVLDPTELPVEVSDVPGADLAERERTVRGLIREEGAAAFDLDAGPLIRARVHRLDADDHVVQWTVHHAAIDGWSIGITLHEIGTAYHAYADGTEPDLEPIEEDYAEFVRWHRDYVAGPRYADDVSAWRDRLRGYEGIRLPTTVERRGHEFRPGYLNMTIQPDLTAALNQLGKRSGTSLYMTGLAAYATVLAAHSGADEVAVVTPNALRVRSQWERLIGWFVNRLVVRVPVARTGTFADLLRSTRKVHTAAFSRPAIPFESLRAELELPDEALSVCFSVQNAPFAGSAFRYTDFEMELAGDDSGLEFAPIGPVYAPIGLRYESAVSLTPQGDVLVGGWEYDAGLFDEATAKRWRAGLLAVLNRVAAAPDTPVRELFRVAGES
jgi:amino acid adenylation domain-containing protein